MRPAFRAASAAGRTAGSRRAAVRQLSAAVWHSRAGARVRSGRAGGRRAGSAACGAVLCCRTVARRRRVAAAAAAAALVRAAAAHGGDRDTRRAYAGRNGLRAAL
jgi:hypothetical protein